MILIQNNLHLFPLYFDKSNGEKVPNIFKRKANTFKAQINQDIQDAIRMGISGTPSVFVNGKIITPSQVPSFEEIKAAVEIALASAGK